MLLALVPTYGLRLVALCVMLSCFALRLPSSMLVMAAGGFAAAGDLDYRQLVLATCAAFIVGDQLVYAFARRGGPPLIERLKRRPRVSTVLDSAESLLDHFGIVAVFLSRTVLSPIGAWVSFLRGALGLSWMRYSAAAAVLGALCWSLTYGALGYVFASRIDEIAALIGQSTGLVLAGTAITGLLWWLVRGSRSAGDAGRP